MVSDLFLYQDIKITYEDYGNAKGPAVLFLHGWGQNIAMMKPIANPLVNDYRIIILDLPGFGTSEEPSYAWSLNDYVEMIHSLLNKLKVKELSLIGHSFGGKLALLYASRYKVKNLVLLASPYCVHTQKVSGKVKFLKFLAKIPGLKTIANEMKRRLGSTDYQNASPVMRDVLVKHIYTDLTENAKKIKCPTFIIWGSNDTAVPLSDAYMLEKLIPDAGLAVYDGCTHYAYLENLEKTNAIIASFLKGE